MRYKITQRLLAGSPDLVWVVWDTQERCVVEPGSYVLCSNLCRELNRQPPLAEVLKQKDIDSPKHRRGFYVAVTQLKNAVFGSTRWNNNEG